MTTLEDSPWTVDVPPGHGLLSYYPGPDPGDTRLMWDKNNRDEVAAAQRTFRDLTRKGYIAARVTGKKGAEGEQIREFDPAAERIILRQPLQGG